MLHKRAINMADDFEDEGDLEAAIQDLPENYEISVDSLPEPTEEQGQYYLGTVRANPFIFSVKWNRVNKQAPENREVKMQNEHMFVLWNMS